MRRRPRSASTSAGPDGPAELNSDGTGEDPRVCGIMPDSGCSICLVSSANMRPLAIPPARQSVEQLGGGTVLTMRSRTCQLRLLAIVVLAASPAACGPHTPDDQCIPPATRIALTVSGGQQSLTSYVLSGACAGSGDASDCRPDATTCKIDARRCPCTIDVSVTTAQPFHACQIDVTSANGTHFKTNVDVIYDSGYCPSVQLVDPSQSIIEVTFPDGGVDAGPPDSAVPADATADRL